jgi:hypothetical protein
MYTEDEVSGPRPNDVCGITKNSWRGQGPTAHPLAQRRDKNVGEVVFLNIDGMVWNLCQYQVIIDEADTPIACAPTILKARVLAVACTCTIWVRQHVTTNKGAQDCWVTMRVLLLGIFAGYRLVEIEWTYLCWVGKLGSAITRFGS